MRKDVLSEKYIKMFKSLALVVGSVDKAAMTNSNGEVDDINNVKEKSREVKYEN